MVWGVNFLKKRHVGLRAVFSESAVWRIPVKNTAFRPVVLLVVAIVFLLAGNLAAAGEPASFSVVLLPDTQNYSEKFPATYLVQTLWIKDLASRGNVEFVIHLGDIVQTSTVEKEWQVADRAQRVLDGAVPYSVLPGNHDGAPGDTGLYNKYFPSQRFEDHAWYGGGKDGKNDNNYCFFQAAGMEFMVLSLEYNPRAETLQWANEIVASHPAHRVIVATHSYLTPQGRNAPGNTIFEQLIRRHENIFLVVAGHVLGVHHQTSTNDAGRPVHEVLCDYQGFPNGGDGWLQTLRFVPGEDKIYVEAYSPLLDQHHDAPEHTYVLDYDMTVPPAHATAGRRTVRRPLIGRRSAGAVRGSVRTDRYYRAGRLRLRGGIGR
jgi:hypothetical protein